MAESVKWEQGTLLLFVGKLHIGTAEVGDSVRWHGNSYDKKRQ